MASQVEVDQEGRIVNAEERWAALPPPPYILTPEDARNLRMAAGDKQLSTRLAKWRELQPIFTAEVWQQVLAHIEGME